MCCMKSYCTRWTKGVKYAPPSTKRLSRYLSWNYTASKVYLVYVPSTRKIIYSYDVVFDESFYSLLAYTSQLYAEAISMRPAVKYTPCDTSLKERTGNIITFTQFEEGNILTKNCNDAERGKESDDESIMPTLLSEEDMDAMYSGDESDHDLTSTEMLEDSCEISQTHPNVNRR